MLKEMIADVANGLEIEMALRFRMFAKLPILGRKELIELTVQGFDDADKDGNGEFVVSFEIFDGLILDVEPKEIEIPTALVTGAIMGGGEAMAALFDAAKEALRSAGVVLPF